MILRLGILVFLLTLKNVLAEQRLPTLPKITLKSDLRSLKQIHGRSVSARYSSNRDLLVDTVFRSLKSSNGVCAWDPLRKECSLSAAHMLSLVEKSNTELSKIVIEELECAVKTNKDDCNTDESCLWIREMDRCEYRNRRIQFNDSACIQAAPLYFDFIEAETVCGKINSRDACDLMKQCEWSSGDGHCQGDLSFVFFGVDRLNEKSGEVFVSGRPMLDAEYANLRSSTNFTWETLLAYKFSSVECPSHIEQLVCDITNVWIDRIWSSILYCSDRYKSNETAECTTDELCSWNYNSSECELTASRMASAEAMVLNTFTKTLPDGTDKDYLNMTSACYGILVKENCIENCIWNPINKTCQARISNIVALFQAPTQMSNDAVCLFVLVTGFSPCFDKFSESECYKTEFCRWNAEDECEPNEEYYLSAAADEDRKLKRRYRRAKKRCSKQSWEDRRILSSFQDSVKNYTFIIEQCTD